MQSGPATFAGQVSLTCSRGDLATWLGTAYREAFSSGETRLILTPDSEFFRYLRESPAGNAR